MTREQGPAAGWEFFDQIPAVWPWETCFLCGEAAPQGYLEVEADICVCERCFAALPESQQAIAAGDTEERE